MQDHLSAVVVRRSPLEIYNCGVVAANLAKSLGLVVEDRNNKNEVVGPFASDLGQNLNESLGVRAPFGARCAVFVIKAVEPFLKFIKQQRSRLQLKHFLQNRFAGKKFAGRLKLTEKTLAVRMAGEDEIPKEFELAMVDWFRNGQEATR